MRKLIVCNIMSVDGYYEGPGNDVMALPMDGAFDAYNAERLRSAGTLLLGRATYQAFLGFWPGLADDPGTPPTLREISRLNNAIDKVVVSDSLTEDQTGPWCSTTRIIGRAAAAAQLADLKRAPGGDILVFGSRTLWNGLLVAGLVDELHLMIGAVMLGGGTPALDSTARVGLRLVDLRRWDDSDNVLLRHEVIS